MPRLKEFMQERAKLVKQARGILDLAEKEKRELSADENTRYENIMTDVDKIGNRIEMEQKVVEAERTLGEIVDDPIKPEPKKSESRDEGEKLKEKYVLAYRDYLAHGNRSGVMNEEFRALQMDSDTAGGYIVAPEQFVNQLIKDIDNAVIVRRYARTFSLTQAESLGAPVLDNDPDDADWTSELGTGSADSTMSFGKRELRPHPLAKRIKVSRKLLRAAAMNPEQLVRDRLAYKFSVTEENAFLNGSGAQRPLGVFTASDHGISTSQDVSTGNSTTAIAADNLIEVKYSLKPGYWPNARWIFHRDAIKQIRKLKDGEGQYIWKAGLSNDRGDTILDLPVHMSEYAPNTFTTGEYVGILGDFSYYWIADALNMSIQRLDELYAENNQVGFIGRLETDGMPVLENAFARVTLA